MTAAEAPTFTNLSVTALRDAIKAGWNGPNERKEPNFDALRGRDDSKKLLTKLETRNKAKAAKEEAASK